MTIERIGVVGAGQMGAGIAQVAATVGLTVRLADVDRATAGGAWRASSSAWAARWRRAA
ncbi:MAG: 3-hydroxyacyl-CoA dehydrogenase NAD-binding domain-containing protein [bacterium]